MTSDGSCQRATSNPNNPQVTLADAKVNSLFTAGNAGTPRTPTMATPFKPFKKGTSITFTTGSRAGTKEYGATVLSFVPKGAEAKVSKASGLPSVPSNRDRYVVAIGETQKFANAKSAKAV
jgi:hypothetical protein